MMNPPRQNICLQLYKITCTNEICCQEVLRAQVQVYVPSTTALALTQLFTQHDTIILFSKNTLSGQMSGVEVKKYQP